MLRAIFALALCGALTTQAVARDNRTQNPDLRLVEYQSPKLPPAGYQGQWWTAPDNCQYSRAGRPGEVVWYLIVNSAHSNCALRLVQRAYSDYR